MIDFSCRYYKASRPCVYNKEDGSECPTCTRASHYRERVLFIKLDAIGDVLRSASLLPTIARRHQAPYIAWLTRVESVELVSMMRHVDEVIQLSDIAMARVATGGWDHVYSLSNDLTSASIATAANGRNPTVGYDLRNGVIAPSNTAARHWLEMAAFDRLKRDNRESYQALMMSIVGGNPAVLDRPALEIPLSLQIAADGRLTALFPGSQRRKIAVNIGSGGRWPKKMIDDLQIFTFIKMLLGRADVDVVLVGGATEADKSHQILAMFADDLRVRAALTERSIPEFVALLSRVDALLCGDTLALHIATALGLPTVSVFGPTSMAEIPDYDGLVAKTATTELDCLVCYGDCNKTRHCMALLDTGHLVELTMDRLSFTRPADR
jgi:ADP-heptose:LPS heptosyltransferase